MSMVGRTYCQEAGLQGGKVEACTINCPGRRRHRRQGRCCSLCSSPHVWAAGEGDGGVEFVGGVRGLNLYADSVDC